jgi:hypothetical protein
MKQDGIAHVRIEAFASDQTGGPAAAAAGTAPPQ